ncbi:DUF4296 domain-containing protein [Myroides phaeus]|uniref:DUF4296 domain-containing protein n=1 Tax=Myroides phaeus TaxID=702745 RepID=UPI001302EC5E|nr:DUF4296 domain-containing protein [Myroides phaeus]
MNKFLVILAALVLGSCSNEAKKPTPFIEEQKMEDILFDMSLLYSIESVSAYSREDSMPQLNMNSILKKYDIDSLTFVENNKYYIELKEGVYHNMQENINRKLEALKVETDSLIAKEEEEKDKEDDIIRKQLEEKLNEKKSSELKEKKDRLISEGDMQILQTNKFE